MKVSLEIDDIVNEEQDYLADMLENIIDRILVYENTNNKVDSIILCFQNGSEEEIR